VPVTERTEAQAGVLVDPRAWLASKLATPVRRAIRAHLAMDAVVVIGAVFVAFRLLDIYPWNVPVLDFHAYWTSHDAIDYSASSPFLIGAYLYSPAFAHVIAPLTALPFQVFAGLWSAILVTAYIWMTGRWALPLLFSIAVALEFYLGQIDILIAAAIVVGFRYPAAWAFPLLTKVAPGVGLLWFAFRREWRSLLIALTATIGVAAISAILAPTLWKGWIDLLLRSASDHQEVNATYLALPIWLRMPAALALLYWGARTDRYWTVPVAAFLAMPILWVNVFTILLAAVPLLPSAGRTPARDWLLRTHTVPRPQPRPARAHRDRGAASPAS
jgi:hypothetical protein